MKILLVEDEKFILECMAQILTQEGYSVYTADNYEEAIEIISTENLNLIISDIMLPYIGGFDILDFVKSDPKKKNIPVILITGMDEGILENTLLKADACITKPFTSRQLLNRIKTFVLVPG